MLVRTALPLLRQRSFIASTRLGLSRPSLRSFANQRSNDNNTLRSPKEAGRYADRDGLFDQAPLRTVKAAPGEKINPQPTHEPSPMSNPVAAPEQTSRNASYGQQPIGSVEGERPIRTASQQVHQKSYASQQTEAESTGSPESQPENFDQPGPLPDLTRGIPSTIEAELSRAQRGKSSQQDKFNITEEPEETSAASGSGGGSGGGDLPRSAYVSSSDRRRSAAVKYVYLGLTMGITGYILYLGRNWDSEEERLEHPEAPDGYTPGALYDRIRARFGTTVSYYSDPVTTKLLPDEEADPNLRMPFVLVLSLEDLLVHSEWSRQTGWRIAKRPGVDYFLRYLSQYYELVLFTSQPSYIADQILRKLDPYSVLRWPLFREHTLYKDGGYVKDISYLNRDLKKTITIDTDPHHVRNQPENAIVIPKWTGDPNDQTLIQLIPFLEYVATMGIDDTRQVLKSFEGKSIPVEFARRERLIREKFEKEQAEKRKSRKGGGFSLGSMFGAKQQPQGLLSADASSTEGKMIWDQIREQGQRNYLEFDKKIREEGAKWLEEREAEEKRMQEEFSKNMKSGMFGFFGSNKPATDSK